MKNLIESNVFGGILGLLIFLCIIVMMIAAAKKKPVIIQLILGIVFILLTSQLIVEALAFPKYSLSAFALSVFAGIFLVIGIKTFCKAGKTYKEQRAEKFLKELAED